METSLKLLGDYPLSHSDTLEAFQSSLLKILLEHRLCMLGYLHSCPLLLMMVISSFWKFKPQEYPLIFVFELVIFVVAKSLLGIYFFKIVVKHYQAQCLKVVLGYIKFKQWFALFQCYFLFGAAYIIMSHIFTFSDWHRYRNPWVQAMDKQGYRYGYKNMYPSHRNVSLEFNAGDLTDSEKITLKDIRNWTPSLGNILLMIFQTN